MSPGKDETCVCRYTYTHTHTHTHTHIYIYIYTYIYLRWFRSNYMPKKIQKLWKKSACFFFMYFEKYKTFYVLASYFFYQDLNPGCLVYMFSLLFSGSKFYDKFTVAVRVRKSFSYTRFCRIQSFFDLCLKLLFRRCKTYVLGCSFMKTCSLTDC